MQHSRKAKLAMLYLWIVHVALGVIGFPLLFLLEVESRDRFLFTLTFLVVMAVFVAAYYGVWTFRPWGRQALVAVRWIHRIFGVLGLVFFLGTDPGVVEILTTATIVTLLNSLDTGALNAIAEESPA